MDSLLKTTRHPRTRFLLRMEEMVESKDPQLGSSKALRGDGGPQKRSTLRLLLNRLQRWHFCQQRRINIGSQYQAEIPELLDGTLALKDQHKATLVWLPNSKADSTPSQDTRLDDLMNLVCSSVMYGGGTNPELAMHCLHECRGDVMVRSKTVAQCVEFYYTYKKQAKIKVKQEEENDCRQQVGTQDYVDDRQHVTKTLQNIKNERADVAHEDQKNSSVEESSGLMPAPQPSFKTPPPAPPKPHSDSTGKKNRASTGNKSQGEPEGIFPCKKCSRVFYKVKSRSAHMKSHAEQEKKAAAQRQREEEELAAKARQEMLEAARRKEAQREGHEESSGAEESSVELDDEQDEDWH
ncbi:hypothetical protein cypCar_00002375 [Cyprinus carpio]|nr:hypothetical protein cypCar_00002375 [Cyprinus carpio]